MAKEYLNKLKLERLQRIEGRTLQNKKRSERKLMVYTDTFNEMFTFFLKSYRRKILDFCGSDVVVENKRDGEDARFAFRLFDNGQFKGRNPESVHPNILKAILIGKKSWGLFCSEWAAGISDSLFTKDEILEQFHENDIKIPDAFIKELDNKIVEFKIKKYENYLSRNG